MGAIQAVKQEGEEVTEGVKWYFGISILCLLGIGLFADSSNDDNNSNKPSKNQGNGSTVIIEEEDPYMQGPYWMGPGVYDGIWFGYPEAYYGYYGYDDDWDHNHDHHGDDHGGQYHGGGYHGGHEGGGHGGGHH